MSKESTILNDKILPSSKEYSYDVNDPEDISYNFFLYEHSLKKFENYSYITSTCNYKHTAILYLSPDEEHLALHVLKNNINPSKEDLHYKAIATIVFSREQVENVPSDDFISEPNRSEKRVIDNYNIFLVTDNCVLIECVKKRIILVNFEIKKFTTLFVNTEIKRTIRIVSTYDELIVIKKKNKKMIYMTRTYVFCVSNRQLFFFILNSNGVYTSQFVLHFFPFEEYSDSIEEFYIQRVDNKDDSNKWYYIFVVLLDGKFVRYVTNWVTVSIKQILLNFTKLVKVKSIKKSVNTFDKMRECHIKIVHSINCVSFLLLQLGESDILGFKYYNTDSPDALKIRFALNIDTLSTSNLSSSNQNTPNNMNTSTLSNNNYSNVFNSPSMFHNLTSLSINSVTSNTNTNTINEKSFVVCSHTNNSVAPDTPIYSRRSTKAFNYNQIISTLSNLSNTNNDNMINNTASDSGPSQLFNFTSKEKDIIHYNLSSVNNLNVSNDSNDCTSRSRRYQTASKKIYSYTSCHLCSFTQFSNSISIYSFPSYKDIDIIKSKLFYEYKFKQRDIKLYDILHYEHLNCAFLLTNKFIMKIRYSNRIHSLLMKSSHVDYSPSTYNEDLYVQLRTVLKYESSSRAKNKCKVCQNLKSFVKCEECKKVYYCCNAHLQSDQKHFHFIECELLKFISTYEKTKKKEQENTVITYKIINNVVIMVNKILHKVFSFITDEKDYRYYLVYIKIILNILRIVKIENFLNKNFVEFQKSLIFKNDIDKLSERIYNMELWFFYINVNTLYNKFANKGNLILLSSMLFQNSKLYDLVVKRLDNRSTSTFGFFGFTSDLLRFDLTDEEKKKELASNTKIKLFFFDLINIYSSSDGKKLNIYERFVSYMLRALSSLLKIGMDLHQTNPVSNKISNYIFNNLCPLIPLIFEEKMNIDNSFNNLMQGNSNTASNITLQYLYYFRCGNYEDFLPTLTVSYCYFFLSLILVRLNKINIAIKVLNYIFTYVQQINEAVPNEHLNILQAKILINSGILSEYIGDFNMGIHKIEECYRLCFKEKILYKLYLKCSFLLIMSYINIDKVSTAFLLAKSTLEGATKHRKVSSLTGLPKYHEYMAYIKLKSYLLFIEEYLSYQYNKSQKKNEKKKENNKEPSWQTLLNYVTQCDEDKKLISKEYSSHKNNDICANQFLLQIKNAKDIIEICEFLYELPSSVFEQINIDNSPIKIENVVKEETHDRSMNNDVSMNASFTTMGINKDNNVYFKEEEIDYLDEIEIKITLFDKLTTPQQEKLKKLNNKLMLRSVILRDPKGLIDKFNLNYHPYFSYDYLALLEKMEEYLFQKKISGFSLLESFEEKMFSYKKGSLLYALRNFMKNDKVQNVIEIERLKYFEMIQPKTRPTLNEGNISEDEITKKKHIIKKIKDKLSDMNDGDFSIGYYDNALEQIFTILSIEELEYVLENPKSIFNYIYSETENKFISTGKERKDILLISSNSSKSDISDESSVIISGVSPINMNNKISLQTPSSFEQNDMLSSTKNYQAKQINYDTSKKANVENKIRQVKIDSSSSSDDDDDIVEQKDKKEGDFILGRKKEICTLSLRKPVILHNIEEEKYPHKESIEKSKEVLIEKEKENEKKEEVQIKDECSMIKEEKSNYSPFITENITDMFKRVTRKTSLATNNKIVDQRKNTLNLIDKNIIEKAKENNKPFQRNNTKLNTFGYSNLQNRESISEKVIKQYKRSNNIEVVKKDNKPKVIAKKEEKQKEDIGPMDIINAIMENNVIRKREYRREQGIDEKTISDNNSEISNQTSSWNQEGNSIETSDLEPPMNYDLKKKPTYKQLRDLVFKKKVNSLMLNKKIH